MSKAYESLEQYVIEMDRSETIDGACPADYVHAVDLDIAYSPVLYGRALFEPYRVQIAKPDIVVRQEDGRYRVDWPEHCDFQFIDEQSLKLMRARFLLWHGYFYRAFDSFSYPDKQKVLAWWFPQGMVRFQHLHRWRAALQVETRKKLERATR